MSFAQKIYINNKPLVLTTDATAYIQAHPIAKGFLRLEGAFPRSFRLALQHIHHMGTLGAIIEDFSEDALMGELYDHYEPVNAGGGVVVNEHDEVLMIFRRGKWDLPKGKCDEGEAIDACALREVSEETGLQQLHLGDKICDTYHVYSQNRQNLLKRTTWYFMKGTVKEQPVPQAEENIQEVKWVKHEDLSNIVYKSYEAIREVILAAGVKW